MHTHSHTYTCTTKHGRAGFDSLTAHLSEVLTAVDQFDGDALLNFALG